MTTITLTLAELAAVIGLSITLALLPGADLAKLGLALLYRRFDMNPAQAEAVQDGEDVDLDDDGDEDS